MLVLGRKPGLLLAVDSELLLLLRLLERVSLKGVSRLLVLLRLSKRFAHGRAPRLLMSKICRLRSLLREAAWLPLAALLR